MNVLLFLPSSKPAFDILSLALYLKKKGNVPFFISTSPKDEIHHLFSYNQIKNHSLNIISLNYKTYINTAFKFAKFVKQNQIDLVLSNNLQGNFVAILAQFLHRKRTILIRHHSDYIYNGSNINAKRQQRFINRFGIEFIAISERVKLQMIKEGILTEKINRINLGFDFNLYISPEENVINSLKSEHQKRLRLCIVARLIPLKRHLLLFKTIRILHDSNANVNILLWVVGNGPLMNELKEWVNYYRLEDIIIFTGFVENPLSYVAASDLLVHISESEASSHVVREAALVETPVLVCKDVGDFEDYITDNKNGFFIDKNVTASKLADKIIDLSQKSELRKKTARELKKTVLEHFNINNKGEELLKIIENE